MVFHTAYKCVVFLLCVLAHVSLSDSCQKKIDHIRHMDSVLYDS